MKTSKENFLKSRKLNLSIKLLREENITKDYIKWFTDKAVTRYTCPYEISGPTLFHAVPPHSGRPVHSPLGSQL